VRRREVGHATISTINYYVRHCNLFQVFKQWGMTHRVEKSEENIQSPCLLYTCMFSSTPLHYLKAWNRPSRSSKAPLK